jgi:hypothetical protein
MEKDFNFVYVFRFDNQNVKTFKFALEKETLRFASEKNPTPAEWTKLSHCKCENCSLDESLNKHCPIALNLSGIVYEFKNLFSYEKVTVSVITEPRTYSKDTTVQEGLSSMLGIVMATSGCPVMEHFKPMARFHLPFGTLEETTYRMISSYLVAQYLLMKNKMNADWNLDSLSKIYAEVGKVNRGFAQRLRDAAKKDADVNALVNLDCFATMVPIVADESLKEISAYFSAYMK